MAATTARAPLLLEGTTPQERCVGVAARRSVGRADDAVAVPPLARRVVAERVDMLRVRRSRPARIRRRGLERLGLRRARARDDGEMAPGARREKREERSGMPTAAAPVTVPPFAAALLLYRNGVTPWRPLECNSHFA